LFRASDRGARAEMSNYMKGTAASKGWIQPAESIKKGVRCRLYAPKPDYQQEPGPRDTKITGLTLFEDGASDPVLDYKAPKDLYGDVDAIIKLPFDKVCSDRPRFHERCESQGQTEWYRARWSPSHPDHARCRQFLVDLVRQGVFRGPYNPSLRSCRALAESRETHAYERSASASHADPMQMAADKALNRRVAMKIKRYEAALDRKRMKDGAALAYCNEHRQEVTKEGTPLVAELLSGAYESERTVRPRHYPRPSTARTGKTPREGWLRQVDANIIKSSLSPRKAAEQAVRKLMRSSTLGRTDGKAVVLQKGMDHRSRVQRILRAYDPSRLRQLDTIMTKYSGKEEALIHGLLSKYGPEPVVGSRC